MSEKRAKRHGIVVIIASFLLAFGAQIAGVAVGVKLGGGYRGLFIATAIISGVIPLITILVNILLTKRFSAEKNEMSIQQRQSFITAHRDEAVKTAAEKLSALNKTKRRANALAVAMGIVGVVFAFSTGTLATSSYSYPLLLLSMFSIAGALARIPMKIREEDVISDKDSLLAEEDYPRLYALAKKAAAATGCDCRVQLSVLVTDYNAAMAKVGNTCVVMLGAMFVSSITEEELYTVLLHEFAHIKPNLGYAKHASYNTWITGGNRCVPGYTLLGCVYSYFDLVYCFDSFLYQYAVSVVNETEADLAMATHGDKAAAVSALLKLKYYELFEWEEGTYDIPCSFESEEAATTLYQRLSEFNARVELRATYWNSLVDRELLSQSASHPTLKMRMETLGVKQAQLVNTVDDAAYTGEAKKLMEHANTLFCNFIEDNYEEHREQFYLKPKARVDEWEAAGKPVTAEGYADVVDDLRTLGRCTEANELCKQAMESLSDTAASSARFMYGAFLLHSFNPDGIELLYKVAEDDHNKTEEALEMIGRFCCLTGDEEGLNHYREQCADKLQFMEDAYDKTGYIKSGDILLPEELPDGMLEDILSYLHSIDGGRTERVYLVNKPITEEFSTSAFILRLDVDTPEEESAAIFHKMFRYLDTGFEHQFSLFDVAEVPMKKIEAVENSLVYQKEEPKSE